jgi:hypothetical protein
MTDTAGRERLREAFHRHRDGCNGRPHRSWYRGENKCDALTAVALAHDRPSGSGPRGFAALKQAIEDELALRPPGDIVDDFEAGANAAYNYVLSCWPE